MKSFLLCVVFLSLIQIKHFTQGVEGTELPYKISDAKLTPLRSRIDTTFQRLLTQKLNSNKQWKKLIKEKSMCIGVVDISDPNNVKFARVNGNVMMYAASLPKIAVLLSAMDAIEKGEIKETKTLKKDLRLMISKSDNAAATRMIDLLG